MASPDLTAYTSLVLYDKDPQDMVAEAIAARQTAFPAYQPQEGDVDLELMGSLASIVAEIGYALNRSTNGLMEVLARGPLNVLRSEGAPATATVTVNVTPSAVGVEIPAGTAFSADLGTGTVVLFLTDTAVVSAASASTVVAPVTATVNGTAANNLAAGTSLAVRSPVTAINSATLATVTAGGSDPESDESWLTRIAAKLARQTQTLVQPADFLSFAADWPGVYRAYAVNNWDASGTVGAQGGHITVATRALGGAAVSAPIKAALLAAMDAQASADLIVHVIDAPVTTVTAALQVTVRPSYDGTAVRAAVKANVLAYLNTDVWDFSTTVYATELVEIAGNTEGVDHVISATVNGGATLALTGAAPLVTSTTGTVTVT